MVFSPGYLRPNWARATTSLGTRAHDKPTTQVARSMQVDRKMSWLRPGRYPAPFCSSFQAVTGPKCETGVWVVAISVNKLLGSSRAKLQKNLRKQSPTVLVRARAIKAPLDRLIPAIVVASCCRLSVQCRQNRPMWRWKLVLNVKGRFWKQRKVYSKLIWCAIWRALRLSHGVLNDSLPRGSLVAWNRRGMSLLAVLWSAVHHSKMFSCDSVAIERLRPPRLLNLWRKPFPSK